MKKNKGVIWSIKRKWFDKIMEGEKEWEYRTQPPKSITFPYLGFFYISGEGFINGVAKHDIMHSGNPDKLIRLTEPEDPDPIRDYFDGRPGSAIHIDKAEKCKRLNRSEIEERLGSFTPPQNFQYVDATKLYPEADLPEINKRTLTGLLPDGN